MNNLNDDLADFKLAMNNPSPYDHYSEKYGVNVFYKMFTVISERVKTEYTGHGKVATPEEMDALIDEVFQQFAGEIEAEHKKLDGAVDPQEAKRMFGDE